MDLTDDNKPTLASLRGTAKDQRPADSVAAVRAIRDRSMQLTDEELATVARLRRLKAGEPWGEIYDGMYAVGQSRADMVTAADILLRLLPEDDGEAADIDWMMAVGRKIVRDEADGIWVNGVMHINGLGELTVCNGKNNKPTRGDVRRLASALGITLTEKTR